MSADALITKVLSHHKYGSRRGAFFGGVMGRPIGSGVLLKNCRIPFYQAESKKFLSGKAIVCVLTHECDIDQSNSRMFNDKLIVAPIIDFRVWFNHVFNNLNREAAINVGTDIVADTIYRVLYLPTIPNTEMEYGGFIYLNEITNVRVDVVHEEAEAICSLSEFSFRILSYKLENHLLRPKSSPLMTIN